MLFCNFSRLRIQVSTPPSTDPHPPANRQVRSYQLPSDNSVKCGEKGTIYPPRDG